MGVGGACVRPFAEVLGLSKLSMVSYLAEGAGGPAT